MTKQDFKTCPYCNREAKLVTGDVVYPHRPDLYTKNFWLCEPCEAFVGCHPGTLRPLGTLATKTLRQLRLAAHNAFDPIWKSRKLKRKEAYQWLAKEMGIDVKRCHISQFNEAECEQVVELSNGLMEVWQ